MKPVNVLLLSMVLSLVAATPGQEAAMKTARYHGIRRDDPGGGVGLRNPERGWRTEAVFAEPDGSAFCRIASHLRDRLPGCYSDATWLLDAAHYEPFGLTLAQMYCYLDEFQKGPISAEKLEAIQRGFDGLRAAGLKAVLRFAYEKSMEASEGPTLEVILNHLEQLGPMVRQNADVLFVLQAGFVGAWGEWHSSALKLEQDHANLAAVVKRLLEVLPENRMTQVRVPKYKKWVLSDPAMDAFQVLEASTAFTASPAARMGFHNDGFLAGQTCGGTWTEAPRFSNPGNPEFDYMTAESPYVAVDGELFWSDISGRVDGFKAAQRMRLHHYSSFSIAHSYSEMEGQTFGIDIWIQTPLEAAQAVEAKLPISDGYFEDREGNPLERTQFEYIRDHLGYRIELQEATWPERIQAGAALEVAIALINRGFSTLINPRTAYLVLIDPRGAIAWQERLDTDPRTWQPFDPGDPEYAPQVHTIRGRFSLASGLPERSYLLGLWLPDEADSIREDARYAVRVANRDVPWWTAPGGRYGVNILGPITVVAPGAP